MIFSPAPSPPCKSIQKSHTTSWLTAAALLVTGLFSPILRAAESTGSVAGVVERITAHDFHPGDATTKDRDLGKVGIAGLDDQDWKVRVLAVRDLTRLGKNSFPDLIAALGHENQHVRYLAAMSLGILRAGTAVPTLTGLLTDDPKTTVRSQAAISLGQIGLKNSLPALKKSRQSDPSRDVKHQAELAVHQIASDQPATPELAKAWASLDESSFETLVVGEAAPDFTLTDTEGKPWTLSEHRGKTVALIWVFADWCPICHGEFRELINLRDTFEKEGITVATLEIHDTYRCRVMAGKEIDPEYWFSDKPFSETYTEKIWWPHLADRAGAVGARYGIDPLAYAVHSEYINRPSVILIDPEGIVRFAYYGTFYGDRPNIHRLIEMTRAGDYRFEHPKRLKPGQE